MNERALPDALDGVVIVRGSEAAARWRRDLVAADRGATEQHIADVAAAVTKQLRGRDELDATEGSIPLSVDRVYWTLVACVIAALTGVLAVAEPLSHDLPWLAAIVVGAGAVIGFVGRRYKLIRLAADAWLATIVTVGLLALFVYARA